MTSKVDQIRALLKAIETGDPAPLAVVNEAKYIQHNPQTHEGSEGLAQLFQRLSRTNPRVNMVRGFQDGDYVFAHMEYDFSSPKICFEVFRFEDGLAVEHWDNIQERSGPNRSGRSMVDGQAEASDHHLTEANRALVRDFAQTVLLEGRTGRLEDYLSGEGFIDHNPHLGDGTGLLRDALREQAGGQPVIRYRRIHRVLAEGNFVLLVSEGERAGAHTSFYDLFRVENGRIAEHWDTTEKVAPQAEWKNSNGKF
jgi:predicted SnoaL-like aldol condensation-catalyzing enzyme